MKDIEELELEVSSKKRKLDDGSELILKNTVQQQVSGIDEETEYFRFKNLHTPSKCFLILGELHRAIQEKTNEEEVEKLILIKRKEMLIKLYNLEEIQQIENASKEILRDNKITTQ
jgi:hypothetical protein